MRLDYASIPLWKKLLICCILKPKKWRLARAHNMVAASMLLTRNHALGEAVRAEADKLGVVLDLSGSQYAKAPPAPSGVARHWSMVGNRIRRAIEVEGENVKAAQNRL
jgi:hypothetical protein